MLPQSYDFISKPARAFWEKFLKKLEIAFSCDRTRVLSETALYGSRGASGVIQVKTKKGTGKGFQISYDGSYGIFPANN